MEPSTKLEELYSYHQKGMEEILSRQQLEELFRHPEQKTGEFEHWLNTQCQTGQLKKLVPLVQSGSKYVTMACQCNRSAPI